MCVVAAPLAVCRASSLSQGHLPPALLRLLQTAVSNILENKNAEAAAATIAGATIASTGVSSLARTAAFVLWRRCHRRGRGLCATRVRPPQSYPRTS
jgi:hypothetical protein